MGQKCNDICNWSTNCQHYDFPGRIQIFGRKNDISTIWGSIAYLIEFLKLSHHLHTPKSSKLPQLFSDSFCWAGLKCPEPGSGPRTGIWAQNQVLGPEPTQNLVLDPEPFRYIQNHQRSISIIQNQHNKLIQKHISGSGPRVAIQ